jgi:hypothetical protein
VSADLISALVAEWHAKYGKRREWFDEADLRDLLTRACAKAEEEAAGYSEMLANERAARDAADAQVIILREKLAASGLRVADFAALHAIADSELFKLKRDYAGLLEERDELKARYRDYIKLLDNSGKTRPCFCGRARLPTTLVGGVASHDWAHDFDACAYRPHPDAEWCPMPAPLAQPEVIIMRPAEADPGVVMVPALAVDTEADARFDALYARLHLGKSRRINPKPMPLLDKLRDRMFADGIDPEAPGMLLAEEAADSTTPLNYPEKCPTCGEPYSQSPTPRASICSNGFHCCRACEWADGKVTDMCVYHWKQATTEKP